MKPTSSTPSFQLSSRNSFSTRQLLTGLGLQQYIPLIQARGIDLPTLSSLSNSELRDDLMIAPLAHRRAILEACKSAISPSSVPLFGSILVHLSNLRTFHSWLSNAIQITIFAFALLRFAPQLQDAKLTSICSSTLVGVTIMYIICGATLYYRMQAVVQRSELYHPDWVGAGLVLLLSLAVASITLSIVVIESIP